VNQDSVSMLLVFNITVLQFLFHFNTIIHKIKVLFCVCFFCSSNLEFTFLITCKFGQKHLFKVLQNSCHKSYSYNKINSIFNVKF